jgi:hypothetical protein
MTDTASQLPPFVRDLLASQPKRGEGLNNWLFRVARVLHAFRSENEIVELLRSTIYGQPVRRGEIERAVVRSKSCAWKPGEASSTIVQPPKPKLDQQKRQSVIDASNGAGLVDLWERSPIRLDDDQSHTEEIIDALFPGNPFLCVGLTNQNFDTLTRNEWRGKLATQQLIVPSPMTARRGLTQDGKLSAHTLEATGPRRFLIVEQDHGSIDDQAAVLLHLVEYAPLVLAVHSGQKSIHGWFVCRDESEQTLDDFMSYALTLGADPATWTRSQFVRMPDGRRQTGERQTVFYFDPEQLA